MNIGSSGSHIIKVVAFSLAFMVALLLLSRNFYLGAALVAGLIAIAYFGVLRRPNHADPELRSMRASLEISRDDINDIVAEYDNFLHGTSTDAVAERTLYYPALVDENTTESQIVEFKLRVSAARRFTSRLDSHLADPSLSKESLNKLISVADERAAELALSWADARKTAKRLGPS